MIVYHQRNVAAFVGAHVWYWPTQPLLGYRVSATSATTDVLISQARSVSRFVFGRVHGRVN